MYIDNSQIFGMYDETLLPTCENYIGFVDKPDKAADDLFELLCHIPPDQINHRTKIENVNSPKLYSLSSYISENLITIKTKTNFIYRKNNTNSLFF